MTRELNDSNNEFDAQWIKAESGATFLCPAVLLEFIDEFSEEELEQLCVRSSINWHVN